MKKTWLSIGTLAFLFLWACHLGPENGKDTFDVAGDSTWTQCDTVTVALLDAQGNLVDTLFHDSLASLDELKKLDASGYDGKEGSIAIRGTYKGGGLCFEQNRRFVAGGKDVVVDTLVDPKAVLLGVDLEPVTLTLGLTGGSKGTLTAKIIPRYAVADIQWSLDPSGIVTLEVDPDASEPTVKVTPVKVGKVRVTAVSRKDPSKSASSQVQVVSSLADEPYLNEDSLLLYVGGEPESLSVTLPPALSGETIAWSSADGAVAEVDSKGVVTGRKAGNTTVKAALSPSGKSLTAKVGVKVDAPVLTVTSKTGAPVNVPITFASKAAQEYGHLVLFKWDLDGDAKWDDSLAGPWYGESVDLPPLEKTYAKEGAVTARFAVRDSEGNETLASVGLDIGNQPPEVLDLRADTLISIKDSIKLAGSLRDVDGKVVLAAFDYDGDGDNEDSLVFADSLVSFEFGHRYNDPGEFKSILTARDQNGKVRKDTVKVTVVLDPPVADAGDDITVLAGSLVPIQAKGTDKFGAIAKREIKVGTGAYISLSKQDTSILVTTLGAFDVVVRVTDDDGQSDEDTVKVIVIEGSKSNADLAALRLSKGTLEPGFKPVTLLYSTVVPWADSTLTLEATPADPAAKLAVNGKSLAAGTPSDPLKLNVGTQMKAFEVVVTAQDGTQKIYAVSVTRSPNTDARLSRLDVTGFALKPAFAPGVLDYADTVANAVAQVTLKPVPVDGNATVTVNDTAYPAGSAARTILLHAGGNPIRIVVTAQDGTTKRTYRIGVARKAKRILYTRLGGAAPVLLDSTEILPNTPDSIKAVAAVGWTFAKWTVEKGNADVSDSLKAATQAVVRSLEARLVAHFAVAKYTITAVAPVGGTFSFASAVVEHGKDTTVTVTALATHRVGGLRDNGVPVSTTGGGGLGAVHTYSLKGVTADHKLEATFIRAFSIKAQVTGNGKVDPSAVLADSGSTHSFTFSVGAVGHHLSSLTDNGSSVLSSVTGDITADAVYKLENVKEDHNLAGGFTIRTFTITTVAPVGGAFSFASAVVEHGKDTTVTMTPLATHRFGGLNDNGVAVSTLGGKGLGAAHTYTLKGVTADHKLEASFVRAFTIKVEATGNGKASPTSVLADSGTSHDITFSVGAVGQHLSSLTDNGTPVLGSVTGDVNGDAIYRLANVNADHTLIGAFTIRQFTLTVVGIDLCVRAVPPPCPVGQICPINLCFIIRDPPDSVSYKVDYGTSWIMSTSDTNSLGQPFLSWSATPTGIPAATTNPDTVLVTSDATYRATYRRIIICPIKGCIDPIDPIDPILRKTSARDPEEADLGGGAP